MKWHHIGLYSFSAYKENLVLRAGDIEHKTLDSAEIRGNRPRDSSLLWVNGFF